MTYKTNTVVFAFAAMLMVMPLANSNAFGEEIDASLDADCGFTVTSAENINFGSFGAADNALAVGEEDAVFPSVLGTTASAIVSLSVADWFGTGTRATGTIELTGATVSTDTVTVGSNTYLPVASTTSGLNFDNRGDDIADAKELAIAIRAQDSNFNVSTSGTSTVSVEYKTRGTGGNTIELSEVGTNIVTKDSGDVTTTNVVNGASSTPQKIMDGDTTKFTWDKTAAQNTSYLNKVGVITVGTPQEVMGSTVPGGNVHLAIMIDPASATFSNLPYDGPLTQAITITVNSACNGT